MAHQAITSRHSALGKYGSTVKVWNIIHPVSPIFSQGKRVLPSSCGIVMSNHINVGSRVEDPYGPLGPTQAQAKKEE